MAKATKLAANHFVRAGLDWREPDRNERTGNCVTCDPHAWQKEIVDYVLGGKLGNHRAIHWHMKFASCHYVVFPGRIIRIKAQRI